MFVDWKIKQPMNHTGTTHLSILCIIGTYYIFFLNSLISLWFVSVFFSLGFDCFFLDFFVLWFDFGCLFWSWFSIILVWFFLERKLRQDERALCFGKRMNCYVILGIFYCFHFGFLFNFMLCFVCLDFFFVFCFVVDWVAVLLFHFWPRHSLLCAFILDGFQSEFMFFVIIIIVTFREFYCVRKLYRKVEEHVYDEPSPRPPMIRYTMSKRYLHSFFSTQKKQATLVRISDPNNYRNYSNLFCSVHFYWNAFLFMLLRT